MNTFYTFKQVTEKLNISYHELQNYVDSGEIALHTVDWSGKPEIPVHRYAIRQFFEAPEGILSIRCEFWKTNNPCPEDCEYANDPCLRNCYCGPNAAPDPDEHRCNFKLEELVITQADFKIIRQKVYEDPQILDNEIKFLEAKKREQAEIKVREFIALNRNGKIKFSNIILKLRKMGYGNPEIHDIIHSQTDPDKLSRTKAAKKTWVSRQIK